MSKYCPISNIKKHRYPHLLVTAGLHDPRVGYWEPCKFVAKLRANKTDQNLLLLKVNSQAGHFARGEKSDKLREFALLLAFVIHSIGS